MQYDTCLRSSLVKPVDSVMVKSFVYIGRMLRCLYYDLSLKYSPKSDLNTDVVLLVHIYMNLCSTHHQNALMSSFV